MRANAHNSYFVEFEKNSVFNKKIFPVDNSQVRVHWVRSNRQSS